MFMVKNAAANLDNRKAEIDALNVFPVPDGDTGTNMAMTLNTAYSHVRDYEAAGTGDLLEKVAAASLRGARGNSGVILSQLFRGLAKNLSGSKTITTSKLAYALKEGSETIYKAVMKPTEGTMLTVVREVADCAIKYARECSEIVSFLQYLHDRAIVSLNNTPNLLPILKQANVVDAGGAGIVAILQGFAKAAAGEEIAYSNMTHVVEKRAVNADIKYIYCTELLIFKYSPNASALPFRQAIDEDCDSLLVIDDGDIVKVHIHTNNPGQVLIHASRLGEMSNIKIDNMKEQHNEKLFVAEPQKRYGIVAVANGEGLHDIFLKMGVDFVVDGGQSSNPSTEDIRKAVECVSASEIFILPCNKNIITTARQVASLTKKKVHVINASTIPQGISAILAFNPDAETEENLEAMQSSLSEVKSGSITHAHRNSVFGRQRIAKGDVLGLNEGSINVVGKDVHAAAIDLIADMQAADDDCAAITLYYGCDVSAEDAENLAKELMEIYPDSDIFCYNGGQPIYDYIISIE